MYVSWRQGDVGHEASSASAGWVVDYLLGRELAGARQFQVCLHTCCMVLML